MPADAMLWTIFGVLVLGMMALDFGVFHRRAHAIRFKEAAAWSAIWIGLALGFAVLVARYRGCPASLEFLTGYLIEESLSVDNLFVFLAIFACFAVPRENQHSVLFWGILGAMVLRAVFIVAGVALIHQFRWIIYLFGAILIISGFKLGFSGGKRIAPEKNLILKMFRRWMPVTKEYAGNRFLVHRDGQWWATPLLLVLIVIETSDLFFAMDSIPAVLAITDDKLIIYTSNVFAIMGLRAIYFALKGALDAFHRLHYGLGVILIFVGAKMLLSHYWTIPTAVALGVVGGVLAISIAASLVWPRH